MIPTLEDDDQCVGEEQRGSHRAKRERESLDNKLFQLIYGLAGGMGTRLLAKLLVSASLYNERATFS